MGGHSVAKAIHTMIRVLDLDKSMDFYKRAFGLDLAQRFDFNDFTLAYLRNDESEFEIELTWNHGQEEPYTHGSGYGHVALSVDDCEAEHGRMVAEGLAPNPVKQMEHDGQKLARFFFVEDPDGYKIEVIERQGRYV